MERASIVGRKAWKAIAQRQLLQRHELSQAVASRSCKAWKSSSLIELIEPQWAQLVSSWDQSRPASRSCSWRCQRLFGIFGFVERPYLAKPIGAASYLATEIEHVRAWQLFCGADGVDIVWRWSPGILEWSRAAFPAAGVAWKLWTFNFTAGRQARGVAQSVHVFLQEFGGRVSCETPVRSASAGI